jgi:hypothetical protein
MGFFLVSFLGYLAGLFLCGMTGSQECVDLLQKYLDITGDVQVSVS